MPVDNARKVDLLKIKFPESINTKEVRSNNLSFRHAYVDTNPVKIAGENTERNSIVIRNISADTVWIGNYGVIAGQNGNGFPLRQWESLTISYSNGEIYAIVEANNAVLTIVEE